MLDHADLLIHPIGELVTALADGPCRGQQMSKVQRIRQAALAAADGKIIEAGDEESVLAKVSTSGRTRVISADGRLVTAGLVDPHTHLIFAGNRANEFLMRCQGKTYMEIAREGGGIVASMRATRAASLEQLVDLARIRLQRMLASGTTTVEVKTGYGLDLDSELVMLEAVKVLRCSQPVEIKPTFMAAHAIPPGSDHRRYVDEVISSMLPAAAAVAGPTGIFNDVFCDEGYFTLDDARRILEAGLKLGMRPKVHADEFANLGATRLAVELNAVSADHLLNVSNQEIELLAASPTIAVLLPGTSFYLNMSEHAPARKMIEHGVAVALGSDYNPGSCHIFSLPFIWGLACLHLKMTAEEALTALTVNAAHAIGMGATIGQLRSGYQADVLVYDVSSLEEVPYNLGWNPIALVIKGGKVVYESERTPAAVHA